MLKKPKMNDSMKTYCYPGGSDGKVSAYNAGDRVQSLGQEDPLKKEMANHSSILAWRFPWIEEPGSTVHGVTKRWT